MTKERVHFIHLLEGGNTVRSSRFGVVVVLAAVLVFHGVVWAAEPEAAAVNSGPTASTGPAEVELHAPGDVVLGDVPTSTWTYGSSATSAGMVFGYYDRVGYSNMYAGPTNGGVAPLTDLGQGSTPGSPIAGSTSIIATENGFDGRVTDGHVDDYWVSTGSTGPDPWVSGGTEHTWGDSTADYMGTNQWKWDYSSVPSTDGTVDSNVDGNTTIWFFTSSASKLHDYQPNAALSENFGTPDTSMCHGLRLFAESRGYTVEQSGGNSQNFTQAIDTVAAGGFSFNDYKAEIDAKRPVIMLLKNGDSSVLHNMVGVGYNPTGNVVIFHDAQDNSQHTMTWGGTYTVGTLLTHHAMTVVKLNAATASATSTLDFGDVLVGATVASQDLTVSETGGLTRLDYQLGANPTGFTVVGAGSGHFVTSGSSQNHAVSLDTSTVGDYTGTGVDVDDTAVASSNLDTVTLDARVLDHSDASFSSGADQNGLVLDFGTFAQGSGVVSLPFDIYNLVATAGLTAGLDLDAITPLGDTGVLTTDLALFSDLGAGTGNSYVADMDTTNWGTFSATYTFAVSDEDLPGALAGTSLVLTLQGTVLDPTPPLPEPAAGVLLLLGTCMLRRRRR
jgi:hypothetical protein